MYEEITVKRHIDWKSLLFKIGILLLVVFIICAFVLTPKNSNAKTPYNTLANELLRIGKDYYDDSKLPTSLGYSNSITLKQMIDSNIVDEKDYSSNNCDYENSYVKVTKVGNNEFSIYVYLLCNNNEEVVGDSIVSNVNNKTNISNANSNNKEEATFSENEEITVTVSE